MTVEYHPSAASDLNDAIDYYDGQRAGLGAVLRADVYAAIERVIDNPELYAEVTGVRRALVQRFPYSVIYKRVSNSRIRILVIRHHKRHPEYGVGRQ